MDSNYVAQGIDRVVLGIALFIVVFAVSKWLFGLL